MYRVWPGHSELALRTRNRESPRRVINDRFRVAARRPLSPQQPQTSEQLLFKREAAPRDQSVEVSSVTSAY
jgi:hypothetical protein